MRPNLRRNFGALFLSVMLFAAGLYAQDKSARPLRFQKGLNFTAEFPKGYGDAELVQERPLKRALRLSPSADDGRSRSAVTRCRAEAAPATTPDVARDLSRGGAPSARRKHVAMNAATAS